MYYDKTTGEIKIEEKAKDLGMKKRIVKNNDDLEKERLKILKAEGLDEKGYDEGMNTDAHSDKILKAMRRMNDELDIDPREFYVFSRDFMRVDVGLMIQRPPIFMAMRERDL